QAYQRVYKRFYVMGRRSAQWYEFYFGMLEREKTHSDLRFEAVLTATFEATGRVEPSLSSKLLATVRPDAPVYDEYVRVNLGISKPRYYKPAKIRLADARTAYQRIEEFYADALPSDEFGSLRAEFDQSFPALAVTYSSVG